MLMYNAEGCYLDMEVCSLRCLSCTDVVHLGVKQFSITLNAADCFKLWILQNTNFLPDKYGQTNFAMDKGKLLWDKRD